jgi:hypothetical protein
MPVFAGLNNVRFKLKIKSMALRPMISCRAFGKMFRGLFDRWDRLKLEPRRIYSKENKEIGNNSPVT